MQSVVTSGPQVSCPSCGSPSVSPQKKGFGTGKGCCGAFILGPIGLLCGMCGANKLRVHCLACGHEWSPGGK